MTTRDNTVQVKVGNVPIGGGAPIVVQSMTNTNTADIEATTAQVRDLCAAGSELVRFTVNTQEAAAAASEIAARLEDSGCRAALVGDFHYNGHKLLADHPDCARVLDKYRINPGNVGVGPHRDERFATICKIANNNGKAIRIGVNAGSLNQDMVQSMMRENANRELGKTSEDILAECMVLSALESTELALSCGVPKDRIVLSCKSSTPRQLINVYRELARRTDQPLHLGLTEAGLGVRGLVWSSAAMAILLEEGIGDTIRVSLTPRLGGDRREEVYASCELLQALGLRSFMPSITSCPGCGRTTSTVFQKLAEDVEAYVREQMPEWKRRFKGVETLSLAVMGCVVNGPGESKAANIGISLPGSGEEPSCPVYVDGTKITTLSGSPAELGAAFKEIIDGYVGAKYPRKIPEDVD
jgi:(E)-4-hydroxy-3-methylbut-2-enyl-diphosphate synthase